MDVHSTSLAPTPIGQPTPLADVVPHPLGLSPAEIAQAKRSIAVADTAAARTVDRFPWAVALVSVSLLSVLAVGAVAQARFADSLTFLKGPRATPAPVYSAQWSEPPRTLDDIIRSIRSD